MRCEHEGCDGMPPCQGEVRPRKAMTAYCWDGKGVDPNGDVVLCEAHAEEYRRFWQEQWDEYYGIVREGIRGAQIQRELESRRQEERDPNRPTPQEMFEDFASHIKFK